MKWAQTAVCSVSLHERIRVVRPSRSVTVQVTIRDQNGASQGFQAVGASTGRVLHDTTSSASISIRGEISPNLMTPRSRRVAVNRNARYRSVWNASCRCTHCLGFMNPGWPQRRTRSAPFPSCALPFSRLAPSPTHRKKSHRGRSTGKRLHGLRSPSRVNVQHTLAPGMCVLSSVSTVHRYHRPAQRAHDTTNTRLQRSQTSRGRLSRQH